MVSRQGMIPKTSHRMPSPSSYLRDIHPGSLVLFLVLGTIFSWTSPNYGAVEIAGIQAWMVGRGFVPQRHTLFNYQ
jgi:hypothetical protein